MKISYIKTIMPLLLLLPILFFACSEEQKPAVLYEPVTDTTGSWIVVEAITENCDVSIPRLLTETIELVQDNNNLAIAFTGRETEITGIISGSALSCSGSVPYEGATVSFSFNGALDADLTSAHGTASWSLKSGNYSCSGTAQVKALKLLAPEINASGCWKGSYVSDNGNEDFSFLAIQENENLAGLVPLPWVISPSSLAGLVTGDKMLFYNEGNDHSIVYTGTVEGSSASGVYYYDDHGGIKTGTWQAERDNVEIKKTEITETIAPEFPLEEYYSLNGMAATADEFFIGTGKYIHTYDRTTGTTGTILSPFSSGTGLCSGGEDLAIAYNAYVRSYVYKFSRSGESVIPSPVSMSKAKGIVSDGTDFWIKECAQSQYTDIKLHRFDRSGGILKTIPCADYSENLGLAFDGINLWYTKYDRVIKSDTDGNVLAEYQNYAFTSLNGIYFNNGNLWIGSSSQEKIWRTDSSCNILDTITIPYDRSIALVYDDPYIYYLYGWYSEAKLAVLNASGTPVSEKDVSLFNPTGLAFDGEYFWLCNDDPVIIQNETAFIYRIDKDLGNFFETDAGIKSMTSDASAYWAINDSLSDTEVLEIDNAGSIISSFSPPRFANGDIASDGTDLWISGGKYLYKISKSGNLLGIYYLGAEQDSISSIAFDGQDLWCCIRGEAGLKICKSDIFE